MLTLHKRLKRQDVCAILPRNYDGPNTKKSSLGAHEPAEDIKSARGNHRKPKRMICTSYDPSKRQRSVITSPKPRSHDNPTISKHSKVCFSTSSNNRVNVRVTEPTKL
jgi:hypothetical protein